MLGKFAIHSESCKNFIVIFDATDFNILGIISTFVEQKLYVEEDMRNWLIKLHIHLEKRFKKVK